MIVVSRDVFCDGLDCAQWTEGVTNGSAAEARARAQAKGWTRPRREGRLIDLCPRCAKCVKEEKKEGAGCS